MSDNIFEHGIKNELRPKAGWHNIKRFLGRKISIRGFNLVLGALALLVIGMMLTNCPDCPEQEECEACEECPEVQECVPEIEEKLKIFNTYVCPDGTIAGDPVDCRLKEEQNAKYICGDGTIVDDPKECKKTLQIDTEYKELTDGITLAVDDIDYEMKGDDWGTITQISYAVINNGPDVLLPEIHVKVYNESDATAKKSDTKYTIKINKTLEEDEFVQGVEDVYVSFKGINVSTKFVLVNGLDESPHAKVVLERPLK